MCSLSLLPSLQTVCPLLLMQFWSENHWLTQWLKTIHKVLTHKLCTKISSAFCVSVCGMYRVMLSKSIWIDRERKWKRHEQREINKKIKTLRVWVWKRLKIVMDTNILKNDHKLRLNHLNAVFSFKLWESAS